jgi:hypothetical protein
VSGQLAKVFALLNADQIRGAVVEYIRRHCDKPDVFARCALNDNALRDLSVGVTIDCGTTKANGGDTLPDGTRGADGDSSTTTDTTTRASTSCRVRITISVATEVETISASSSFSTMSSSDMFIQADSSQSAIIVSGAMTDSEAQSDGLSSSSTSDASIVQPQMATVISILATATLAAFA